jgi:hypothetical protein
MGDTVDSGVGLSYRSASICIMSPDVQVLQPYAGVNFIPQSGTMNLATAYSVRSERRMIEKGKKSHLFLTISSYSI